MNLSIGKVGLQVFSHRGKVECRRARGDLTNGRAKEYSAIGDATTILLGQESVSLSADIHWHLDHDDIVLDTRWVNWNDV